MIEPKVPENEKERLAELDSYAVLDTLSEADFDNLTSIASDICGTPIALVSLIDEKRQWFKSHHGLDASETPKEFAFCAHAINEPNELFIVPNAKEDERFHDNPLSTGDPNVIFYAGVPLVGENNLALGTLCVIDHIPRELTKSQLKSLSALANQVMNLLKLRKNKILLEKTLNQVQEKSRNLEMFAFIAAHDLKSPLNTISNLAKLFKLKHGEKLDADGKEKINLIQKSSNDLKSLVDGLLEYSQNSGVLDSSKSSIEIKEFVSDMSDLFSHDEKVDISLNSEVQFVSTNKTALKQILINLISNAIKYNDKPITRIEIGAEESEEFYHFYVQDNGPGISADKHEVVFELFRTLTNEDRFGEAGNGIGLSTVKKLVEAQSGKVTIESEIGVGSKFMFFLRK